MTNTPAYYNTELFKVEKVPLYRLPTFDVKITDEGTKYVVVFVFGKPSPA